MWLVDIHASISFRLNPLANSGGVKLAAVREFQDFVLCVVVVGEFFSPFLSFLVRFPCQTSSRPLKDL